MIYEEEPGILALLESSRLLLRTREVPRGGEVQNL